MNSIEDSNGSKVVVYFLAKTKQMEVSISFEHQNFKWLPHDQALETLTYENARALLRKAEKHLPLAEGRTYKGEPIKRVLYNFQL